MALFSSIQTSSIHDAHTRSFWRGPVVLLFLFAIAQPLSFSVWSALLNNFVIEAAQFDGVAIGWLQTVREIPGFFAFAVIAIIVFVREQVLAVLSLLALGLATAVTAWFPTFGGILITTFIGSLGFHYFETVNQSLQLQWIKKERAPQTLGWITAAGSGASLVAYAGLVVTWKAFDLSYNSVYLAGGLATVVIALVGFFAFPQFTTTERQHSRIILRRRYWLFYALEFVSGARRQIFVVFAAFMMVERFGFEVHELTALFLINYVANMLFAPVMGMLVARFGERRALVFEYAGLVVVFLAYGGIYYFGWGVAVAAALYIVDHLFFALAFALKTYFQKIADPKDIAPTAAVSFTINHIAAVFLPAMLGYLWIVSPGSVFGFAAGIAGVSLFLALLIPRNPSPGNETIFSLARTGASDGAE